jgi:hypothetical protein
VRRTGKLLAILAVTAGPALSVPIGPARAAGPSAYQQVLRVYEATGAIAPCRFSSPELQRALGGVDTYGAQYFADFTNAVQAALTARAAGTCGPAPAQRRARVTGATGVSSDAVARLPSVTAPTSAGVPVPLVVLAALAVAGALGGGVALVRASGRSTGDRHRATDDLPT